MFTFTLIQPREIEIVLIIAFFRRREGDSMRIMLYFTNF